MSLITHKKHLRHFFHAQDPHCQYITLVKLPIEIQDMLLTGLLSEGHARTLIEFSHDHEKCIFIANEISKKNYPLGKVKN